MEDKFNREPSKQIHTPDKNHKCNICSKVFTLHENLKRHVKTVHDRITRHKCEPCGKTFKSATNFRFFFGTYTFRKFLK